MRCILRSNRAQPCRIKEKRDWLRAAADRASFPGCATAPKRCAHGTTKRAQLRCNLVRNDTRNLVAMQENPAGSTYCRAHDWSYNARVLQAGQPAKDFWRRRRPINARQVCENRGPRARGCAIFPGGCTTGFHAARLSPGLQSGMTIACVSADVRAACPPAGSTGVVTVSHGFRRLPFQSRTARAAYGRNRASFPFAIGDGAGPAEGVISRRAFRGRRQACREACTAQ